MFTAAVFIAVKHEPNHTSSVGEWINQYETSTEQISTQQSQVPV